MKVIISFIKIFIVSYLVLAVAWIVLTWVYVSIIEPNANAWDKTISLCTKNDYRIWKILLIPVGIGALKGAANEQRE